MEDVLYTIKEVSRLIKSNEALVRTLIKRGFLPALKLGSLKIPKEALLEFLKKYEGYDLSDLNDVKPIMQEKEPA